MAEPIHKEDARPVARPLQPAPPPGPERGRAAAPADPEEESRPSRARGIGIKAKILAFLLVSLAVLALVSGAVSSLTLQRRMNEEFQSRGVAIASGLASTAVELILTRDASTIQAQVDQYANIEGVAYVMVNDPEGRFIAHTFAPLVPEGIVEQNTVPGEAASHVAAVEYADPATGELRRVLDVGVPILAGQLGTVRVGIDRDVIAATARRWALLQLAVIGVLALVAAGVALLFANRLTRPLNNLARAAEQVGRGDLSVTAPVESSDEVGLLAETFNQSLVRLRRLQAEQERQQEEERRANESLQENIRRFLRVAVEISQGDLTRRGEVSEDALGNVVDSINLVVEELGEILAGVRRDAEAVGAAGGELIAATEQMDADSRSQAENSERMRTEVAGVTQSVRAVSESAAASASAARNALQAAEQGQSAVSDTLGGMQRIRGEVQGISKRIKSLGDRSLEISEIVDTITSISAQTNLLALNAAIEASGAGGEGSRFAVVAGEVRKLAEDTSRATKRVAALVQSVQAEVKEAVSAMETGTREVEGGFQVAQVAGARLQEIAEISQRSAELAQQISARSQEQVGGVERVAQGIDSIAAIAERTAESVRGGRRSAEKLRDLASVLTERLSRFKLAS